MKLRIHKDIKGQFKSLLIKAFPLITGRLGIQGFEGTITIRFGSQDGERGAVGPAGNDNNCARLKAGKRFIDFDMTIKPDDVPSMFATHCHEMYHVKQWVTGQQRCELKGDHLQTFYYNVEIKDGSIPYRKLPWEKEAFDGMYPLAEWVIEQLIAKKSTFP